MKSRLLAVYLDVSRSDHHDGPELLEAAGFDVADAIARTPSEVVTAAHGASVLLVGDSPVTQEALEQLPTIRIVSAVTVGLDHIDLEAARRRGVWVCNVPEAASEEAAVHALAMALALIRHLAQWDRHVRSGGWDVAAGGPLHRPSRLRLGIVGLGRTGRRLAEMARPVFGELLGADPAVPAEEWPEGVAKLELDQLFAAADVVSLHLPLNGETERLVDARRLELMRPGSYLVNVSRGGLIDGSALLEALDQGRLAGAALDVLPAEPPTPDDPLIAHPRILLSPHAASASEEADRLSSRRQAENVVAWHQTGRPVTPVVGPDG